MPLTNKRLEQEMRELIRLHHESAVRRAAEPAE
jgi:hypothetical protein